MRAPKLIWNADTPNVVPAGARISAGKSGEGRKIVPFNRCRHGEMTAGELHSIAGVACKTDNCGFDFLPVLVRMIDGRYFRHRVFPSR